MLVDLEFFGLGELLVAPMLVEPKMPLPPLFAGVAVEPWPPRTAEDWWLWELFIVLVWVE